MEFICSEIKDNVLFLKISGRLDSTNAAEADKKISEITSSFDGSEFVVDAENLAYISSAGLRVVLRLKKEFPSLKIVNTNPEVYDVFDMTGFTEMMTVEKAYRVFSVDGCEVIGKGAKGTVYRYNDDTVIKVYKSPDSLPDILNERELARKAFVLGIPTAISYDVVKVGDSFGSVFELLDAKSYSQLIEKDPENIDKYVKDYAELLKLIHTTEVKATDMPDIKITVNKWLEADKACLSAENYGKLKKLVDNTPDTLNMLHCDYHTNNIMMQNGETLLIDMDTLSHGHPVFELANVYITYVGFGETDKTVVEKFLGIPYETSLLVWKKFIPLYLGTDDETRIKDVEAKVRLLSYTRLMRHTLRRGVTDEISKKTVDLCVAEIDNLLGQVDTLDF